MKTESESAAARVSDTTGQREKGRKAAAWGDKILVRDSSRARSVPAAVSISAARQAAAAECLKAMAEYPFLIRKEW